jgi:hypothetical protein
MSEKPKIGTKEHLRYYQELLLQHTFLLNKWYETLTDSKDSQKVIFSLLVWPILESCQSILILSENKKLRDSLALSRMVLDLALNLGYFSVHGKQAIDKALKHAHQKSYRDLHRNLELDDIKIFIGLNNLDKVEMPSKLEKAIEEYTTTKGNEERSWTGDKKDNVFRKIKQIRQKHGKSIGMAMAMGTFEIYRHSSEILHGSIFGSMYAMGITELRQNWPKSVVDREKHAYTELSLLLNVLCLLCNASLRIIFKHYPDEQMEKEASELSDKLNMK